MEKPSVWATDASYIGETTDNAKLISLDLQNKAGMDTMKAINHVADLLIASGVNDETKRLGALSIPLSGAAAAMAAAAMILRAFHRKNENHRVIDQKDIAEATAYAVAYLIYRFSDGSNRKSPEEMARLTGVISDALSKLIPEQEFTLMK